MKNIIYYLIDERQLGKKEDERFYLYKDGKWLEDSDLYILGKLNGYDPYEPDESPYKWGSTSVMDEIKEIDEKQAREYMKQVILLNGPSSSGKSTLAIALQKQISDQSSMRYEIISIDDLLKMSVNETIYEDDVFRISKDLCKKALKLLNENDGVIIDHVITSERIFVQLKDILSAYPLKTVHVTCPLEVLIRRERERGNRCPGSAQASAEYLFPKDDYDLTIDTGETSPEENSSIIYKTFFEG
ncbi:MAG: AAA family ATPase [Erysipelotrichaceae bacterium]|nr:AAA family ATPase [Erysipelotrichaceae bacterium]